MVEFAETLLRTERDPFRVESGAVDQGGGFDLKGTDRFCRQDLAEGWDHPKFATPLPCVGEFSLPMEHSRKLL
ncbi:hypothetical protein [Singulisphaera acidiphila]|uniref:hypothetical protein n=1 Tax=Singulisphaera acidiphila TaxID=466153 RepID=UPI0012B5FBE8|nr:hypothetical protein [Singulisphaera acidiphila]